MPSSFKLLLPLFAAVPVSGNSAVASDDDKKAEKAFPASEARNHVGQECAFRI